MLLDRLLDSAGLEVVPVAVCDVRKGVRVELPALPEPHVHCVVRGRGALRAGSGISLPLAEASAAIVPAHTPHGLEPDGDAKRVLKVGAAISSDHVPALTAGSSDPGLLFVCGRIRASQCDALGLFDRLLAPAVVSLADVPRIQPMLETLLDEQAGRAPGNRRMTALVMEQCCMHVLRKLSAEPGSALPWLSALRDRGLARAVDGMLRTPSAPHTIKSLAATANMGRATFSQRFLQAFGQAPIDWLNHLRVHEALRLLRTTDLSLDSVAERVGLASGNAMFRQLRAATVHGPAWDTSAAAQVASASQRRARPHGANRSRAIETKTSRSVP